MVFNDNRHLAYSCENKKIKSTLILEGLGVLPENSILVTLDVTSLYTNIPNKDGLRAAREALFNSRPGTVNPTNDSLVHLLEFVLTKNNFDFDNEHYLQIGRCAMGTKVAPSLATLYLDLFEKLYIYTYHLQPFVWHLYGH